MPTPATMPLWLQEVQVISTILVTLTAGVIAIIGVLINRRQSQTAREKFRLDLFGLRYSVYKTVAASLVAGLNEDWTHNQADTLRQKVMEARFFFNAEVYDILDRIEDAIIHHSLLTGSEKKQRGTVYHEATLERQTALAEKLAAYLNGLPKTFEAALKIDDNTSLSLMPIKKNPSEKDGSIA